MNHRDLANKIAAEKARWGPAAAGVFDPSAVREALLSGRDAHPAPGRTRTDLVYLLAAMGQGVEEVGAEVFADGMTASGLFPQLTAQQWRELMIEAEACHVTWLSSIRELSERG